MKLHRIYLIILVHMFSITSFAQSPVRATSEDIKEFDRMISKKEPKNFRKEFNSQQSQGVQNNRPPPPNGLDPSSRGGNEVGRPERPRPPRPPQQPPQPNGGNPPPP